jgi:hypothetical protein
MVLIISSIFRVSLIVANLKFNDKDQLFSSAVHLMKRPLLVVQGKNDPRVPYVLKLWRQFTNAYVIKL